MIVVYLTIVGHPARDRRPGVGDARVLDQPVHPGRAEPRGPAHQLPHRPPGAARRLRLPGRPRRPGTADRDQPPALGVRARRAAAVGGRREHRRVRQHPDPRDPVDLHRRGPRARSSRSSTAWCPPGYVDRGAAAADQRLEVVRRLPARTGRDGPVLRPPDGVREHRVRAAVRRGHDRRGRPAADDPVLRAVRVVAAAGHRRAPAQARGRAAGPRGHGDRVVRDDERHLAAADVGLRRHPPDRRPRVGRDRLRRSRASPAPSSASRSPPSCRRSSSTGSGGRARAGRWPTGRRRRVAEREGREVRRPREPVPGVDEDVDEVAAAAPRRPAAPRSRREPQPRGHGGERATRDPERAESRRARHDPRAGEVGAPEPRHGARRARVGHPRRQAHAEADRPAAGRLDDAPADPGHQRRRHRVARASSRSSRHSTRSATSRSWRPTRTSRRSATRRR